MAAIYEIIRQGRRHLAMAGKTAVHDVDLLIAAGCVDRIEVAYSFGHELRGLSPCLARAGRERAGARWSPRSPTPATSGASWPRRWACPSSPPRNLLGTDTFKHSSAKVVADPWSGKPICLLPACYPDVALIHVPRCDSTATPRSTASWSRTSSWRAPPGG